MPKNITLAKALPYLFIIFGLIGLIAAFVLTQDTFKLAKNPSYIPSCNINPIISCGSVMKTKEATALGFPNPFLGLAAYAAVMTVGVAMLAGAKFKRWFWQLTELGVFGALCFVHYLFIESVYHIHAVCPFCVTVWIATIGLFVYTTSFNIRAGNLGKWAKKNLTFFEKHHTDIYVFWLLVIAALIVKHFWYYFGRHL
jgi:uncharacterized membrane protein